MSLLTNLVLSLEFAESSGNALDAAGGSYTFTQHGSSASGVGPGGVGGSRGLDGSTNYFDHADNADLSTGDVDFTLEFWIYANGLSGSFGFPVVAKKGNENTPTTNDEWIVYQNGTGQPLRFSVTAGTTQATVDATSFGPLYIGTWFHVVCWHDSVNNVLGISIDGTANTASYSGGVNDGTSAMEVGASSSQGLYWSGYVSKVRLWKRVLSSTEISDLRNGGSGLAYADLGGAAPTAKTSSEAGTGVEGTPTLVRSFTPVGDVGTGSETITLVGSPSSAQAGTGSEAGTAQATLSATQAATGSEAISLGAAALVTQAASGAEAGTIQASPSSAQVASGSEAITLAGAGAGSESGTGGDAGAIGALLLDADTATASEAILLGLASAVADGGDATEAITLAAAASEVDAATLAETIVLDAALVDSQAGAGVEDALVSGGSTPLSSQTGTGVDLGALAAILGVLDAGTAMDAASIDAVSSALDAGTGVEDATVVMTTAIRLGMPPPRVRRTAPTTFLGTDGGTGVEAGSVVAIAPALVLGMPPPRVRRAVGTTFVGIEAGTAVEAGAILASLTRQDVATAADASSVVILTASVLGMPWDLGARRRRPVGTAFADTEAGTGVETGAILASLTGQDDGTSDEIATIPGLLAIPGTDTGTGIDASPTLAAATTGTDVGIGIAVVTLAASLASSDAGAAVDAAILFAGVAQVGTDAGLGVDAAALAVVASRTDAGAGLDAQALAATVVVADVGTGLESAGLFTGSAVIQAEAGTGVEGLVSLAVAWMPRADGGAATEAQSLVVAILATDHATAIELAALGTDRAILASDVGHAIESGRRAGAVGYRADAEWSRGSRIGPDPGWSEGVRIGPDPAWSAGVRVGTDPSWSQGRLL